MKTIPKLVYFFSKNIYFILISTRLISNVYDYKFLVNNKYLFINYSNISHKLYMLKKNDILQITYSKFYLNYLLYKNMLISKLLYQTK